MLKRLAPALLLASLAVAWPAGHRAAEAQGMGAPHSWLFGSWTGGLFPVPAGVPVQACLAQPVVVFTRDVVLRASLTDQLYAQRLIETARTAGNVTEFRFTPSAGATQGGLLGNTVTPPMGFGCADPNMLTVQRRSDNEIVFPGCADFPNPLVRCTPR